MFSNYEVDYNQETDELIITKMDNAEIVKTNISKYGIKCGVDVQGNIINIIIPEPSILTGIDIEKLKVF